MTKKPPHAPAYPAPYTEYEDEISLVDLWLLLSKRRWLVLAVTVATVAAAAMFTLSRTPMYGSRAVVVIGSVGEHGPVEPVDAVVQRLTEEYHVHDSSESAIAPPYVDEVTKEGTNAVSVTVLDTTAKGARAYAKEVIDKLLAEHNALFQQAMSAQTLRLKSLNQQLRSFDEQIKSLSEHIDALKANDPAQSAILAVEKGKLLAEKPSLEEQRVDLELAVSGLKSQPTRLIRKPSLPVQPSNMKMRLYLTLGAILGLMLGVIGAFLAEFVSRVRREMRERGGG